LPLCGASAVAFAAPILREEHRGAEPVMLEAARIGAPIGELREGARAALCRAVLQRQRGRVLREEAVSREPLLRGLISTAPKRPAVFLRGAG
jgi:hypothetical protein